MAEIIRIPDGNAFLLRVTGQIRTGDYTEDADFSVVTHMGVNFVRRGRIAQTFGLDSLGRIVIENSGNLAQGVYGVELYGYYHGEPWRNYQKNVFQIVNENANSDPGSDNENVLTYDVTFDVTFGGDGISAAFVEATVATHNADQESHPDLREELDGKVNDVKVGGTSVVEGGVAVIDPESLGKVDDVKVNGVSVVSQKEANVTVPTKVSDLQNDSEFTNKSYVNAGLSGKQDVINDLATIRSGAAAGGTAYQKPGTGIPSTDLSSEVQDMIENGGKTKSVSVNGGTPVTPDENGQVDLTIEQANVTIGTVTTGAAGSNAEVHNSGTGTAPVLDFVIPKGDTGATGRQGPMGESVIVGEGDLPLTHVTGQATNKAMSQKGVTDAVKKVDLLEDDESADFDIADDNGNVIARFDGGHIKTKNFDSSTDAMTAEQREKLNSLDPDAEPNDVYTSNEGDNDLDIADEQGNVVLQVKDGYVRSKNFRSDEIAATGSMIKPRFMIGEIDSDGYHVTSDTRMHTPLIRATKGDVVRILDTSLVGGMMVTEYFAECYDRYNKNGKANGKKKVGGSNGYILTDYTVSNSSTAFISISTMLPEEEELTNSLAFYKNIVIIRKSDIDDKPRYNVPAGYYVSHHSEFSTWSQDTDANTGVRLTLTEIYDACQELEDKYPDYVTMETIGRDASDTYDIHLLTLQPHYVNSEARTNFLNLQKEPKIFMAAMVHGDEHPCGRALLNAIIHICYAGDYTITKKTVVTEGDTVISETTEDYTPVAQGYNTQLVGTSSTTESGGQTTTISYYYKYQEYIDNPYLKYLRWNCTLLIIPVRNPWGLVNSNRRNFNGVDLNRNFYAKGAWANYDGNDKGSAPLSEPETMACWKVLMEHPDVLAAHDLHAHGKWGKDASGLPTWYEKTAFAICGNMPECRDMLENIAVAINKGFTESGWANHRMPKDSGPVGIIQYDQFSRGYFSSAGIDLGIPATNPEVMHKYYTGPSESGSRYNEDIDCMNEEYLINIFMETINSNNLK